MKKNHKYLLLFIVFIFCSSSQMASDEQIRWCESKLILYDTVVSVGTKLPDEEKATLQNMNSALEILQDENNLSRSNIDLWFEGDEQKAVEFYEGVGAELWDEETNDFVPGSSYREYLLHLERENTNMLKYCKIWEEISS